MNKFKVGDRVVVVAKNKHSGIDESQFIGETGEVVNTTDFKEYVVIKFDNHNLNGLWTCDIPGAEPICRRFHVDCVEPEPIYEDFFDQLANIFSL